MRAAEREALLFRVQFALRQGLPVEAALADLPGGGRGLRRLAADLRTGLDLQEALAPLGVRGRRAALLALYGSGVDAADAADLAEGVTAMETGLRAGVVHALSYPCAMMVLALLSRLYLTGMGILPMGGPAGAVLLPAFLLLGLCVLFLLPRRQALRTRWTRPLHLLADAHLLFGLLDLMVRDGAYTPQALARHIGSLDLQAAVGKDAVQDLLAGASLSAVLAGTPAARAVAGITPREEGVGEYCRLMRSEAARLFERRARRLRLALHFTGLSLAGAAIALLGASVYLTVCGSGVPW